MKVEKIESLSNPKVKHLLQLKERRGRKKAGETLIEGHRELYQALYNQHSVKTVFLCDDFFIHQEAEKTLNLIDAQEVKTFHLSKAVFEKVSFRDSPDGFMAIADEVIYDILDIPPSPNLFLLVLESVEKPGNLGAILRTADGAGVDAIILCDPAVDINNPNVIRSSLGSVFHVPTIQMSHEELFQFCEEKKIQLISTSPDVNKVYWKIDFTQPTALVLGSEKDGISERFKKEVSDVVTIPMLGVVDSLNVSASASLLAYEVVRQRTQI